MSPNNTIAKTVDWFNIARPAPNAAQTRVQLGVHFEEVVEMLLEISSPNEITDKLLRDACFAMNILAYNLKAYESVIHYKSHINILDSICDQIVTATGVAHHLGYSVVGALDEVNASNFSKFENGEAIVDVNGKIAKGCDYFKPDLSAFVPT